VVSPSWQRAASTTAARGASVAPVRNSAISRVFPLPACPAIATTRPGLSEHYREIFELTRLDEAITIYDREESALNGAAK
jgi:hypothetical protein